MEIRLKMNKVLILLLWIGLFSLGALAKFKTLSCQVYGQEYGNFRQCKIKAVNRNKNLINMTFDLYQTVESGLDIHMQVFKRANGWRPFLYNFTLDACKFLRKPYHLIARLSFEYVKRFTNINHTCPYKAGTSIIVKDFDFDVDSLRSRFPIDNGEYGLQLTIFYKKILRASINGSIYHFDYRDQ